MTVRTWCGGSWTAMGLTGPRSRAAACNRIYRLPLPADSRFALNRGLNTRPQALLRARGLGLQKGSGVPCPPPSRHPNQFVVSSSRSAFTTPPPLAKPLPSPCFPQAFYLAPPFPPPSCHPVLALPSPCSLSAKCPHHRSPHLLICHPPAAPRAYLLITFTLKLFHLLPDLCDLLSLRSFQPPLAPPASAPPLCTRHLPAGSPLRACV